MAAEGYSFPNKALAGRIRNMYQVLQESNPEHGLLRYCETKIHLNIFGGKLSFQVKDSGLGKFFILSCFLFVDGVHQRFAPGIEWVHAYC